jgi:hypothetical protein
MIVIYLLSLAWRYLVKKEKRLFFWLEAQLWFLKKVNGAAAARQKRLELTTDKFIRRLGIEALIVGILLLLTLALDIVN